MPLLSCFLCCSYAAQLTFSIYNYGAIVPPSHGALTALITYQSVLDASEGKRVGRIAPGILETSPEGCNFIFYENLAAIIPDSIPLSVSLYFFNIRQRAWMVGVERAPRQLSVAEKRYLIHYRRFAMSHCDSGLSQSLLIDWRKLPDLGDASH